LTGRITEADWTERSSMPEATLNQTQKGLVPQGEGWYVLNARDAKWLHVAGLGSYCGFEGDVRFPDLGININILPPGEPMAMYHTESSQEDFLVLAGEALLIVEDEERALKQWDLFHCPAYTPHVIVGAGDGPSIILAVGARGGPGDGKFVVSETAIGHGAGHDRETQDSGEAYARFGPMQEGPYREGSLPD
jgi:uncharacterized cupin superfamily protein